MALESKLELKLTQRLIITPQLQQAIKLLQLSRLELTQLISQELVENPVLEEVSTENAEGPEEENWEANKSSEEMTAESKDPFIEELKFISDDYFEERGLDGRDLGYFSDGEEEIPSYQQIPSNPATLTDYLLWQLRLSTSDKIIEDIGEHIIGNLDENGYLQSSLEEIASISGARLEYVENALNLIQDFDPPGVAARDIRECLLIQLRQLGLQGTLIEDIVRNYLPYLEKKDYQAIAKELNVPFADVLSAIKVIEGLEPKPGRPYFIIDSRTITPDVYIYKVGADYVVSLNEDGMPRLRLSQLYRNLLMKNGPISSDDREYMRNKLRSAIWLMKSIEQRGKTIYKVADTIVKLQMDFFEKGLDYIKPMTLRDIAEEVSMHESTISRVTTNKYMQTPQGLFGFKFFFHGGLPSGGEKISTVYVRDMVKKMVLNEDSHKPLSDQQIAKILREKDINIARRTIAKYRMELKIPPTNIRRRTGQRKETL